MSDYSYYDDLGVSPQASRDELKAAYQDRIAALEAAREKKGVSPAQLQGNRQEAARVRAAWNVLADPFQRSRYDERIGSASTNGDVSDHDDDVIDVDDGDVEHGRAKCSSPGGASSWLRRHRRSRRPVAGTASPRRGR